MTNDNNLTNTEGGAKIDGDVRTGNDFIGRDKIIYAGVVNIYQNNQSAETHQNLDKPLLTEDLLIPEHGSVSAKQELSRSDIQQEKTRIMQEIRNLMSKLIPDFDAKFPVNAKTKLISEIRDEKIFQVNKARALVFGETGVGKTTTINFLLDTPIFPTTGELSCTKSLASVEHKGGLIVYDSPGLRDDEALENVTRSVLGVGLIEAQPVSYISLIDITSEHLEGPSNYSLLHYEQYSDQISKTFYEKHQRQIVCKRFDVNEFSEWAAKNIDFFVFVASSEKSLPVSIAKLLSKLSNTHKSKSKLFKVFNIFHGHYKESCEQLAPRTKTTYTQILKRSEEFELDDPTHWLMIDSSNGHGIVALIAAFAASLPPDILRSLEQVIKREYAHLIHEKLESLFLDYVTRVASVVSVFPADYETDGEDLLHFTTASIITMAEFFLSLPGQFIDSDVIDEFVNDLKSKSEKRRYRKESMLVQNRTDNWLKNVWRDISGTHEMKRVEASVFDSYYTAIGGVKAIKLVLSLGLTLRNLYSDEGRSIIIDDLREMLKTNLQIVQESFDSSNIYVQLKPLLVRAGKKVDKDEKLDLSNEIYKHLEDFWANML